jgi:hypothetical protein
VRSSPRAQPAANQTCYSQGFNPEQALYKRA